MTMGEVHRNATPWSQQSCVVDDAYELPMSFGASGGREQAALSPHVSAQLLPIEYCCRGGGLCRRRGGERGGATRLCRHEPLLSTRSNRWDAAVATKAFRSRRTCTPQPRNRIPGVLTLGSRGNPTHVEHRRQRHNKIDSESASVTRIRSPKFTPVVGQWARSLGVSRYQGGSPGFNALTAAIAGPGSASLPHARASGAHAH